jgi:hypothetical protein
MERYSGAPAPISASASQCRRRRYVARSGVWAITAVVFTLPHKQIHRFETLSKNLDAAGNRSCQPISLTRRQLTSDIRSMNTQQRIDRLEDAVANLGTIMEAEGKWAESDSPIVQTFGIQFHKFVQAVAKERAAKS